MADQTIPDYETIRAAVAGETWAVEKVLMCYKDEIDRQATVKKRQPDGTFKLEIDHVPYRFRYKKTVGCYVSVFFYLNPSFAVCTEPDAVHSPSLLYSALNNAILRPEYIYLRSYRTGHHIKIFIDGSYHSRNCLHRYQGKPVQHIINLGLIIYKCQTKLIAARPAHKGVDFPALGRRQPLNPVHTSSAA